MYYNIKRFGLVPNLSTREMHQEFQNEAMRLTRKKKKPNIGEIVWREPTNPRKDNAAKYTDSEREWVLLPEERFWQAEDKKEERSFLHNRVCLA